MRAVIQRVRSAQVSVDGEVVGRIGRGLLVFVGMAKDDAGEDIDYIASKITGLRVFEDDTRRMNLSLSAIRGQVLVVSQFTLYGDSRRGRRPSFDQAASPAEARRIYDQLLQRLKSLGVTAETGRFQSMMSVELVNDGPVTLLVDSRRVF